MGSTISELSKNPYGYKTKPKPKQKKPKLKRLHAESDSDNDFDQTLFLKFIVLESLEDTPITKLSPFIIEKTLNSLIKAKSVKKLINNTLLIEVEKQNKNTFTT